MSNFTGGNPARGTNKSHRNAMFRNPASFNNAVLPHGALAFLVCAGNMRGAVHDGKTCGGVAHFPLFAPGTNFDPLYALLDGADDGDDGNSDGGPLPVNRVWTLLSKLNVATVQSEFPDAVQIGDLLSGDDPAANSTHPQGANAGGNINGWAVFAVCAPVQPADDSGQNYWIQGPPSAFAGSLTYDGAVAADPVC